MSRPPLTYFGSKMTAASRIVALFPPHRHYVERLWASPACINTNSDEQDQQLSMFT